MVYISSFSSLLTLCKFQFKWLSLDLRKPGLMQVRKVSSNVSLCSPHRLIRDVAFNLYRIVRVKEVSSKRKSSLGGELQGLILDAYLRSCIKPLFPRAWLHSVLLTFTAQLSAASVACRWMNRLWDYRWSRTRWLPASGSARNGYASNE